MSTPLSPAAQAVEDAYFNADGFGYRNGLAAALRAAEEQLFLDSGDDSPLDALVSCCQQLRAIAAELEGQ
jgi:hypothetical protein